MNGISVIEYDSLNVKHFQVFADNTLVAFGNGFGEISFTKKYLHTNSEAIQKSLNEKSITIKDKQYGDKIAW
ncbi:MAG: hypothetical protein PHE51_10330 [Eubacteriales bacterium]|nr:hypothetical protein [Eubacteriales bacterium]